MLACDSESFLTEKLPAQHAEDLGIEVLRHPALSPNREQPRERSAASRIADDLDAGGGVDKQRGSRLGVDAQRAQRLSGIDAFKLRLGTRKQLVNERTERLGRGVLVRIGEHDSRARWKVRRYARHGLIVPCGTSREKRIVGSGTAERVHSATRRAGSGPLPIVAAFGRPGVGESGPRTRRRSTNRRRVRWPRLPRRFPAFG
jgi:hypothetical protein